MRDIKLPLTLKQTEVLQFIVDFIDDNSYPPTLREIKAGTKIENVGLVHKILSALEKKRYILREKRMARGILLTEISENLTNSKQLELWNEVSTK
jgi:repressor LexA